MVYVSIMLCSFFMHVAVGLYYGIRLFHGMGLYNGWLFILWNVVL